MVLHPRKFTFVSPVRVLFTLIALSLTLSVPQVSHSQEAGTIRGRVLDRDGGEPLVSVRVQIRGTDRVAATDALGAFLLSGVPAGSYTVVAVHIGYAAQRAEVGVQPGSTTEVELTMERSAFTLNELVVSASRTATTIRDVPAVVEVVTRATIERTGAATLMEVIQNVSGVTDATFGQNFRSVQLRGLPRLGNENETVLIMIDGVPETDARNSAQLLTIPVDYIDRVEVVKGPNSSLYGRTAVAGVINIITKDPPPEQELRLRVQGGQWGYFRGSAIASGPVGDDARAGYLVGWEASRLESFHNEPTTRRGSSIFGKFTSELGSRAQMAISANYHSDRGGTPAPLPVQGGQILSDVDPTFSRAANLNLPTAEYNQEQLRIRGTIRSDLGSRTQISNTFGYRHSLYGFVEDGDILSPPPPASTIVTLFPFSHQREEDAYFNDLQLETNFDLERFANRLVIGASLERNTGARTSQLPFSDPISFGVPVDYTDPQFPAALLPFDIGGSSYTTTFYGLYVQDEISLSDRLRFTAGGRYDINPVTSDSIAPGPGPSVDETFSKFSPKLGASYRLLGAEEPDAPQLSVYAQYSRAFLPPRAAIDPQTQRTAAPKAENTENIEAGLKASFFGGRFSADATVFQLHRDGIPITVRIGGSEFAETNGGKQRFRGVELGLTGYPTTTLSLFARYAFYDGKFRRFQFVIPDPPPSTGGTDVDLTGNRVANSPRHIADVGLNFEDPSGVGFNLVGHYQGSRFMNNNNTLLVDSYFVTNGRLSWRWRDYSVALGVSNLFDAEYETEGDITFAGFVFPGPPRRVVAELGVTF